MAKKVWTHEELIIAFNLYCKTPFGRIHINNPDIVSLAKLIKRTPYAVSWKLANFASLDTSIKQKGASHGGKADTRVYEEFCDDWERLGFESEKLLAEFLGKPLVEVAEIDNSTLPKEGKEREAAVKIRVNQSFFRRTILASYESKCCITGLTVTDLLIASHIVPWSNDTVNRLNPRNGLCLNSLHDKAFDKGLITVTPEYRIKVSTRLMDAASEPVIDDYFKSFDGKEISLPSKFTPAVEFLAYHNENVFRA